jgi:hypothetical protein
MKANALKLAGVKTEAEFYKKYPTQEAFMQEHGYAYSQSLSTAQYGGPAQDSIPVVQQRTPHEERMAARQLLMQQVRARNDARLAPIKAQNEARINGWISGNPGATAEDYWKWQEKRQRGPNAGLDGLEGQGPADVRGSCSTCPKHNNKKQQYGGMLTNDADNISFENFKKLEEAQYGQSVHTQNMVQNLRDTGFNRTMNTMNSIADPRNMTNRLPNRGFLGQIKAAAGIGAGLAGSIQGYNKMFAPEHEYTPGSFSSHQNDFASMPDVGYEYQAPTTTAGKSGFARDPYDAHFAPAPEVPQGFGRGILPDSKAAYPYANPNAAPKSYDMEQGWRSQELDYNNELPEAQYGNQGKNKNRVAGVNGIDPDIFYADDPRLKREIAPDFFNWYQANSGRADVAALGSNHNAVNNLFKSETASNASQGFNSEGVKRGDSQGMQMAYNSINGFAMANQAFGAQDYEKQYNQRLRDMGNTDARYGANNADNPFGNFTMNTGAFANQALVQGVPVQDFGTKMAMARQGGQVYEQGGEYTATPDDIQRLKDQGYDIEYLD